MSNVCHMTRRKDVRSRLEAGLGEKLSRFIFAAHLPQTGGPTGPCITCPVNVWAQLSRVTSLARRDLHVQDIKINGVFYFLVSTL